VTYRASTFAIFVIICFNASSVKSLHCKFVPEHGRKFKMHQRNKYLQRQVRNSGYFGHGQEEQRLAIVNMSEKEVSAAVVVILRVLL